MPSHAQILEKAIQKAIEGGWVPEGKYGQTLAYNVGSGQFETIEPKLGINDIIFNHKFAKALWGVADKFTDKQLQEMYHATHIDEVMWPTWQYHLQQMVIADDPVKYLGEHL
jgi:hypothetical protein